MLSENIMDYYVVSQGKTSIPGVDDAEELTLTDVRPQHRNLVTVSLSHQKWSITDHILLVLQPLSLSTDDKFILNRIETALARKQTQIAQHNQYSLFANIAHRYKLFSSPPLILPAHYIFNPPFNQSRKLYAVQQYHGLLCSVPG